MFIPLIGKGVHESWMSVASHWEEKASASAQFQRGLPGMWRVGGRAPEEDDGSSSTGASSSKRLRAFLGAMSESLSLNDSAETSTDDGDRDP